MLSHAREPFYMDLSTFEKAVKAVKRFPAESTPDRHGRRKVVGIMGGEPLLHPQFAQIVDIMVDNIPVENRGLWTGLDWQAPAIAHNVRKLLGDNPSTSTKPTPGAGYLNYNPHNARVEHQPVLVAIADVIHDKDQRDRLIADCWLQKEWASAITPKGFFSCEVAAAFDAIFDGPGGFPIDDRSWRFDVEDFWLSQAARWCHRCGVCLPLPGRIDRENCDDVSRSNLQTLSTLQSPRIKDGDFELFDAAGYEPPPGWTPQQYIKGQR